MSEMTSCISAQPFESDTIARHLSEISPLLTEGDIRVVLRKRRLAYNTPYEDLSEREIELAEAEAYYKLCDQPVGGATKKEVDGSWSSTQGGWTVSSENLRQWYKKYVDLREKWGEKVLRKSTIKVHNLGMKVWRK